MHERCRLFYEAAFSGVVYITLVTENGAFIMTWWKWGKIKFNKNDFE